MNFYFHKYPIKNYCLKSFPFVPVFVRFHRYGFTISFNRAKFKTMLLTASLFIVPVVVFLCTAKTRVSFKPFKISFETPVYAAGVFLLGIGVALMMISTRRKSYDDGFKKGVDFTINTLNEYAEKHGKR